MSRRPELRARFGTISRMTGVTILVIVALLVGLRIAAPYLVLHQVNRILGSMKDYHGQAQAVDLNLWRGAYKIYHLKLEKRETRGQSKTTPFIEMPLVDFSIEWKALLHGSVVGEVELYRPQLNLVDSSVKAERQLILDKTWGEKFKALFPLKLNRFTVVDGTLTFRNPRSTPTVYLELTELQAVGTNLTNGANSREELSSHVDVTARVLKTAHLKSHIALDPIAKNPNFDLTMELTRMSLPELNNFLRAYASVDAERGTFQLFSEIRVKNGKINGYAKPIIEDLSLLKLEDFAENPLRFIWEGIVSTFLFLFTNHLRDSIATKIPITGTVDGPEPDILALLGGLFANAYIEHIKPHLD